MKQKITIPESLNDLTLDQYLRFLKVVDGNTGELFIRKKMVQIFCDIPLLTVEKIKITDFERITGQIVQVLNETPDLTPRFSLNGTDYGFIPDLDKDMSLAEFVDLDNLTGNWDEMVQFMSILYRPITKKKGNKYTIEPYKAKKFKDLEGMPLGIAIGAQLFFWRLGTQLLQLMTNYGLKALQTKEIQERLPKVSGKDGVGIHQFQTSLTTTSQELMKYLGKSFIPPYII